MHTCWKEEEITWQPRSNTLAAWTHWQDSLKKWPMNIGLKHKKMLLMWASWRDVFQADGTLRAKTLKQNASLKWGSGSWKVWNLGDDLENFESERQTVVTSWRGSLRQEEKALRFYFACQIELLEGFYAEKWWVTIYSFKKVLNFQLLKWLTFVKWVVR